MRERNSLLQIYGDLFDGINGLGCPHLRLSTRLLCRTPRTAASSISAVSAAASISARRLSPPPPPLLLPLPHQWQPPPPPRKHMKWPPPLLNSLPGNTSKTKKSRELNLGLSFAGIAVIMQFIVVVFLAYKRTQLYKLRD